MNGRFFRENISRKIGKSISTKSYAYIPIRYQKTGNESTIDYFDKYYPVNIVLSDASIHFYHTNLLSEPAKALNHYQSDQFLRLSLDNPTKLDERICSLGKPIKKDNNIFINSKDLDFSIKGQQDAFKNDFLKHMLPDLSDQSDKGHYYKIIFLNFLSDFFYSNVFYAHPSYEKIKKKLEENKIITAILTKGKYFFSLGKKEELSKENDGRLNEKKHWETQLNETTKKWHELITDKDYADVINVENKWFRDKESEHDSLGKNKNTPSILSTEELASSVSWLSSRYNLVDAFKFQVSFFFRRDVEKKGNRNRIIGSYLITLLLALGLMKFFLDVKSIWDFVVVERNIENSGWMYWTCAVIFLSILSIFQYNRTKLISYRPKGEDIFFTKWKLRYKYIVLVAIIAFSALFISEKFYSTLLLVSLSGGIIIGLFFIATIIERILLIVYYFLSSGEKVTKTVMSITQLLELFKPKILLASTSIWVAIYAFQQLWNIDFSIDILERIFLLLIFIGIFSFSFAKFYSYIKTENTSVNFYRLLFRSCGLIFLSLIYSVWIGIGATTTVIKNNFVKEGYYKDYFSDLATNPSITKSDSIKLEKLKARLDSIENIKPKARLDSIKITKLQVEIDSIKMTELQGRLDSSSYHYVRKILNSDLPLNATLTSIQKIEKYTEPKKNPNKELLKILPKLKKNSHLGEKRKVIYYFSTKIIEPENTNKNYKKPMFEAYIIPEFLIFYSFITLSFGIFIELILKKKE